MKSAVDVARHGLRLMIGVKIAKSAADAARYDLFLMIGAKTAKNAVVVDS